MTIRDATPGDIEALARIWYDAWQDAHAAILPDDLRRFRTFENFHERLQAALPHVRVATSDGTVVGFCITEGDELYQLFVAADARGTGIAAALVADAEAVMAVAGIETAWLACAIGNERAARFYEKQGWRRVGNQVSRLPVPDGIFELEVWRYEKRLAG
jgi:GNAT superfamily N-acetyltransferase